MGSRIDSRNAKQARPIVRRARKSDLAALHSLNVELQDYERVVQPSRRPGQSLPRSYLRGLLEIQRRAKGRVFVAILAKRVIGFAACALDTDPLESEPLIVVITDLIVEAKHRSLGVGSALLESARGFARERNAGWLNVTTLPANAAARRFYRSSGFREAAVTFAQRVVPRKKA